ncbi:hypothetical protein ACSBR2_006973 [Camellia fascicularis]|uniref:DUF7866 domain-containing protein n=1 Tax=Camellia sinensis TaxID=4442 RepID=A0A7J7I2N7_CAMSI|nr:uncharacterized protein LOC114300735 [Camellia sinensis]KAF5959292.1 hypothetical protein HYC85_000501 [Camellia sinensis]
MSASGVLFSLFLLLFFYFFSLGEVRFAQVEANGVVGKNGTAAAVAEMVPMIGAERVVMVNESRRKLGSFQICALCTCCGGAKGYCLPTPCCYAINCNIPNRPFGFCSFTPKTCNCFGCHL